MPNLSYHTLGYNHAIQFAEGFSEPQATVGYVILGKTTPWGTVDTPPNITDNEYSFFDVMNSAIGGKKIVGNDVSLVIKRNNWTANTVYTAYDDRVSALYATANGQYVYTTGGGVYRCLNNANNSVSTIEPSGDFTIDNGFIQTSDGYLWKYEYAIQPSDKFITSNWIPVPMVQTQSYYGSANNVVRGAVSRLIVQSGGSGYNSSACTKITIIGNGAGATANANVVGGKLVSCDLLSYGSNYTYQYCKISVSGTGAGANVRPVLSPYRGHGFNPALQLGANTVMISVKIGTNDSTEGGKITANNDYRQIGLLLAPHKYNDNTEVSFANANSAVALTTGIVVTTGSDYIRDEIVYQGTTLASASYRAVVVDYYLNTIYVAEQYGMLQVGGALKGNTSIVNRTVVDSINPDLDPRSGSLVYLENRDPIMRSLDQAESIKFVVSF